MREEGAHRVGSQIHKFPKANRAALSRIPVHCRMQENAGI